jgi:hypothetical protein
MSTSVLMSSEPKENNDMAVMIGVDPHKGSHAAAVLDEDEQPRGELRVRSAAGQLERLVEWAAPFPDRTWAIEAAGGLGYLSEASHDFAAEESVDSFGSSFTMTQPRADAHRRPSASGSAVARFPSAG